MSKCCRTVATSTRSPRRGGHHLHQFRQRRLARTRSRSGSARPSSSSPPTISATIRRRRQGVADGNGGLRPGRRGRNLRQPAQHFRERQTYIIYDNIWGHLRPDRACRGQTGARYDVLELAGIELTVVSLPGVTPHHRGYALVTPGKRPPGLLFSGETIHSPGRTAAGGAAPVRLQRSRWGRERLPLGRRAPAPCSGDAPAEFWPGHGPGCRRGALRPAGTCSAGSAIRGPSSGRR